MFEPAGEGGCQTLERVGVEFDVSAPAVPLFVGGADLRNSRETLRSSGRQTPRKAADAGCCIEHALLRRAVCRGRYERGAKQWSNRPGLQVTGTDLELLLAMLGADRHSEWLGKADRELPRHVEVEQVL